MGRLNRAHLILIQFCLIVSSIVSGQNIITGSITGKVSDLRTNEPLVGATILIEGTNLGTVTDTSGNYVLQQVPTKTYNISASYVGYEKITRYNVIVRSEGNYSINFKLRESADALNEVVVTANPFEKLEETPLSIQKLSQDEIASYPGGNNDIAKVVQSLPGVSGSIGGFRNDIIIRGGAPNENVYYLDGIEIPGINHFSTQGSAGGPVGMLNIAFFEGVTLQSSAFGAQYDNVLGGILQFDQRNGDNRKFGGNFRVGASESALTLEGPLFKKNKELSSTTFIVSVRRSYLQFLFKAIGLPFLPDYWDYQYKISHKIDDHNEIVFTGVGSVDDFSINFLEEFDEEQQAIQDQVPIIRQNTNSSGISWKRRFKNNSGLLRLTLSTNRLNNRFSRYSDNLNRTGLYFSNLSTENESKIRLFVTRFKEDWTISYGSSIQFVNYENETVNTIDQFNYSTNLNFFKYGAFGQISRKWAKDKVSTSLGARIDGNSFTEKGHQIFNTFSPRFSLSYLLNNKRNLSINASIGRYFKIPPYTILGFRDFGQNLVNQNSRYIRSDHLVAGFEYLVSENSRITLEGFLKWYNRYPVSILNNISLANLGGDFEVLGNEPVSSMGKGQTFGLEFLFQQKFNGKLYAILAYTLFRSEFSGLDGQILLPSSWDNRHIISFTGGYQPGKNWEVSARYRFLGKTPFAPIDPQETLLSYPAVIPDYSRFGEVRLDPFSQLDFRVDKKWSFQKFSLDIYLDIQNILSQSTPQQPRYGLLRDVNGEIIDPVELIQIEQEDSGSLIPSLGIVLNF